MSDIDRIAAAVDRCGSQGITSAEIETLFPELTRREIFLAMSKLCRTGRCLTDGQDRIWANAFTVLHVEGAA